MKRLAMSLATLLIWTMAHAQESSVPPTPTSPSASGTTGDTWLLLGIAIAFVVVGIGVYLFIKRNRARI